MMAGNITDAEEARLLNYSLSGVYLALFTAAPGETGGGTEVSGVGYQRQPCAFDVAAAGATGNTDEVLFAEAGDDWGAVSHFAIMDAQTGGTMRWYGAFTVSKTVGAGDQLRVKTGDLTVTLD